MKFLLATLVALGCLSQAAAAHASVADLIGFLPDPGQAKDVVYDAAHQRAYVASIQFGLTVVDVADPNQPRALGAAVPPFSGSAVAASGNYAAVTQGTMGMTVVDVLNPEAPLSVGRVAGTFGAVAMSGRYAYLAQTIAGNPPVVEITTVDLINPANPAIVHHLSLGSVTIGGLDLQGSYLYVAAGGGGFKVIDLSNPAAPKIANSLVLSESATSVAVSGTLAFVGTSAKVNVVDIRIPSSPALKGSVANPASRLTAIGTKAYGISGLSLITIDANVATSPQVINIQGNYSSQSLDAVAGRLVLTSAEVNATNHSGGLYVYDLPATGIPDVVSNLYEGFGSDSVAVSGNLAVSTAGLLGARLVDVSDPFAPRIASELTGALGSAAIVGSALYLEETVSGNPAVANLLVMNVSDPTRPSVAKRTALGPFAVGNIVTSGNLAAIAVGSGGLMLFNTSNPLSPTLLSTLPLLSGAAKFVALADGYAYVAAGSAIEIIDIRNPSLPVKRNTLAVSASALAAISGRLYVVSGLSLQAYNLSSPTSPQLLSNVSSRGAQALTPYDSLLVLSRPATNHSDADRGVHVFDYKNPSAPVQIAQVIVPGSTKSIAAAPGYVVAGDSASTLDVIEINSGSAGSVSGAILYQGMQVPVTSTSVVLLQNAASDQTDGAGQYSFDGLGNSNWTVQPMRMSDGSEDLGIADVLAVLDIAARLKTAAPLQAYAADVSGNGTISAMDGALILKRVVNAGMRFPVAQTCGSDWVFVPNAAAVSGQTPIAPQIRSGSCVPGQIRYEPLSGQLSNQNFVATAFGDVSPSISAPRSRSRSMHLGRVRRSARLVRVPVYVDGSDYRGFSAAVDYDPAHFEFLRARPLSAISNAMKAENAADGTVSVAAANSEPIPSGAVMMLEFRVLDRSAASSFVLSHSELGN